MVETASFRNNKQDNKQKKGTHKMATDILCKAVKFKNPKTGLYAQR